MASVATDDAGPADDTFTLRLTAVMLVTETRWRFATETFCHQRPFHDSGTPTCREGKRRCMADVATDDAGPADDGFTLRLAAVMLATETGWNR